MKRKALISLMLVAVLMVGASLGTYAWFTSQATTTNSHFKTGTLKLKDQGTFVIDLGDSISNMQPGDISKEVIIDIVNDGSLDLAWIGKFAIQGMNADKLAGAIYIDDMKMEFINPNGGNWEPTDHFIENGLGVGTYPPTRLEDADMKVITLKNWMENDGWLLKGAHIGALKPNYKYRLSFKLGMAELAKSEYQNLEMDLQYVVNATQLKVEALNQFGMAHQFDWFNLQIDKQN